jgi:phosphomannomutase
MGETGHILMEQERWLVFDVDGTLTESRQKMDPEFKSWFLENVPMDRVCLVTGSDREKTVEQVGEDFWLKCRYSFQCAGNESYSKGKRVTGSHWTPSDSLIKILNEEISHSQYDELCGKHIEIRPGMLNFSIVGRNANMEQRARYIEFDTETKERKYAARRIKEATGLEAVCGGDTGIDIFPMGRDKSQVLNYLYKNISFFGDRCDPAGNDFALMMALRKENRDISGRYHEIYHVSGPEDTFYELKCLIDSLN